MSVTDFKHRVVRRAARRYLAGPALEDAVGVARASGRPVTLGFWDAPGAGPAAIGRAYRDAVAALASTDLDGYVSVKLPSLGGEAGLLDQVAAAAEEAGQLIHLDSLAEAHAPEAIERAVELAAAGHRVGVSVPGAWSRSVGDAVRLASAGVRIRVVRGQWPGDREPRAGFLDIVDALVGLQAPVAVATHDARLAAEALERLHGTVGGVELELLYGLPFGPSHAVAESRGVGVRLYIPYGEGYVPYTLAQMRDRPMTAWWLVRDAVLGRSRAVQPRSRRHAA